MKCAITQSGFSRGPVNVLLYFFNETVCFINTRIKQQLNGHESCEAIKFMFNSVTMLLFSSIHYGQAISDFSAHRPQLNLSDLWNGRVKVNLSTTKSTVVHTLSSISASHEKVKAKVKHSHNKS